jgi:hypothetical protein
MVNSIEQIKGQIAGAGGLALPNLYKIVLPASSGFASELNILCNSTMLPGRQMLTHERIVSIKPEKMAYAYAVPPVTLTFKLLNNYSVKKYFENWQNKIINNEDQQIQYSTNYKRSVKIYQMSKGFRHHLFNVGDILDVDLITSEYEVYGVELEKAFPTTMNDIELSDASNDQFITFSVTLDYTNWKRL